MKQKNYYTSLAQTNIKSQNAERVAKNPQAQFDSIITQDGYTATDEEVTASRASRDGSNRGSLNSRINYDLVDLDKRKLNINKSYFNATLMCKIGSFHIDFENNELVLDDSAGGSIISVNKDNYTFLSNVLTFDHIDTNIIYIVFNSPRKEFYFVDLNNIKNIDTNINGVVGVIRKDESSVFINGYGYTSSMGSWTQQKHIIKGALACEKGVFIIDFTTNKIITNPGGANIVINRRVHSFAIDKEYSFDESEVNSLFIVFNIVEGTFEFLTSREINTLDYTKFGVIGNLRKDAEEAYISGTTVVIRKTTEIHPQKTLPKILISGDDYNSTQLYEESINYNIQSDDVYAIYDGFMNSNANYLGKETLAVSSGGNPINLYEFKMPYVQRSNHKKTKLVVIGNIHGHEKESTHGLLSLFNDLCNNWQQQQSLRTLRANTHIMFIPILNPDGFNMNKRKNGNGVDLARNFPAGWTANLDPEDWYYLGPAPASEIETNVILALIEQNSDTYFAVDVHNYGTLQAAGDITWLGSKNTETQKMINSFEQSYDMKLRNDYQSLTNYNDSLVSLQVTTAGAVRHRNGNLQVFLP